MCTILFAFEAHRKYRLVLAANRDEFYARPTAAAAFWEDAPELFAGRDLVHGGTWLGVTTAGRIAALTNYREPHTHNPLAPSRGALVSDYLKEGGTAERYLERLRGEGAPYNGYNLLVGGADRLFCYSSKNDALSAVAPGIHGVSNHLLDTPWPKVERGKGALARLLAADDFGAEELFAILGDRERAQDRDLSDTGVGLETERLLSSIFIESGSYGTRSSTVLLVDRAGRALFVERSFEGGGSRDTTLRLDWSGV